MSLCKVTYASIAYLRCPPHGPYDFLREYDCFHSSISFSRPIFSKQSHLSRQFITVKP